MNRIAQLRRSQGGFTLIELLVVVAIIALLATFAVPKLFEAINKAKAAPGKADLQTIAGALDRYYLENHAYPTNLDQLTTGSFLKSTTSFKNGYGKGYFFASGSDSPSYLLIDAQAVAGTINDVCGVSTIDWDTSTTVKNGSMTKTEIDACTAPANTAIIKY